MKAKRPSSIVVSLVVVLLGEVAGTVAGPPAQHFHEWASAPPMGWNSWDIFGTTVTERQTKEQADAMAEKLLPSGYDVLTVDIQWYEPESQSHVYKAGARLQMDGYGRLMPAVRKFPSAEDGKGFKPLADYVHGKGLRFGIHIMRGIPRQAVDRNTPVLGTELRARDIAVTDSTCPWNPDMYGVDATRPGGQAYYDSIIGLYASWGVDYIKCDDISRPYNDVQKAEIEALRKAIDKCGRPIVLSLSPGATPIDAGPHVSQHANLWRITDDFWDRWGLLRAMFERLHAWEPYRRPGAWPDADMLPMGTIEFGRKTAFTKDEQYTLMSLWAIARSPLMIDGQEVKGIGTHANSTIIYDIPKGYETFSTKGVVTNKGSVEFGVLVSKSDQAASEVSTVSVDFKKIGIEGRASVRDLWTHEKLGEFDEVFGRELPLHGAGLYRITPLR